MRKIPEVIRGYTLLELCCCMAIMSTCFAAGAVYWGRSQRSTAARAGAMELASALRSARAEAVTARLYCAVKLYDGTVPGAGQGFHGYAIYSSPDKKGSDVLQWLEGPRAMPQHVRFSSGGNQTFVFGPQGNIVSRGINHKTVRVAAGQADDEVWHDITVLTATGRVKMKERKSSLNRG